MASVTELETDEVLALYRSSYAEIGRLINDSLPKLFWAEKVCEWRGDFEEAQFFQLASQRAAQMLWHPQCVMRLARDELVKRDPARWSELETRVETNATAYVKPEIYDIWRGKHGF